MTREQAVKEIDLQLRMLTLSEPRIMNESASRDLITLKTEIEVLEITLDGEEPWLIEWLKKAHLKGAMLGSSARISYNKEVAEGAVFPFNEQGRLHLIGRFNEWSIKTVSQLVEYESTGRSAAVVAPWIRELDDFKANPTTTR